MMKKIKMARNMGKKTTERSRAIVSRGLLKEVDGKTTDLVEEGAAAVAEEELDVLAWRSAGDGLVLNPHNKVAHNRKVGGRHVGAAEADGRHDLGDVGLQEELLEHLSHNDLAPTDADLKVGRLKLTHLWGCSSSGSSGVSALGLLWTE